MNLNFFIKITLLVLLVVFIAIFGYFFVGKAKQAQDIKWGVNFSQEYSEKLGLDWKENYLAILDDLNVRDLKIITNWDLIEPRQEEYDFDDLDWQIEQATQRQANLILVIGMKTGRWPECHIPDWATDLSKDEQQEQVLQLIEKIVLRYESNDSISYWQVENEPFFSFGECPWRDKGFLRQEIDLVKLLDSQKREIIVSDTGELSLWLKPAQYGDIVGSTMYKKVWSPEFRTYFDMLYPSVFYWRKAQIIEKFFSKKVICVELQAEPWGPVLLYDLSLEEQEKTMNLKQFQKNIEFAQKTGLDEFYLWGTEWWYWLKEKQSKPEIWDEAKKLF